MKYVTLCFFLLFTNIIKAKIFYDFPDSDTSRYEVSILNMSMFAYTNSITLDDINNHFTQQSDGFLDDQDKSYLLSKFEGHSSINSFIDIEPIRIGYRYLDYKIYFSLRDIAFFNLNIPYSAPELILKGNEKNRVYQFNDFDFSSSYYRKYTLGLGIKLDSFGLLNRDFFKNSTIEANLSLVHGYAYVDAYVEDSRLFTDDFARISGYLNISANTAFSTDFGVNHDYANTNYNYEPGIFQKPAGQGFAIDLAWKSFCSDSNLCFSIGLYDIGYLNWKNNTGEHNSNSKYYFSDIFNDSQLDSLEEAFDFQSKEKEFTTLMPTTFRINCSILLNRFIDLPFSTTAYVSLSQALTNTFYNTYIPKFSVILNNHFVDYLPDLGIGIRNNVFNTLEIPIFISYRASSFKGHLGIRDISSYLSSGSDNLSLFAGFTFFIK